MSWDGHRCAACGVTIRKGQLMCRDDWYAVPLALRRAVNREWRDFRNARDRAVRLAALKRYRAAAADALVAALKARP